MAAGTVEDTNGNKLWIDGKRQLILLLKDKPKSGKQQRILGHVRQGILKIERIADWELKTYGCWYINRFAMLKHKELGFNLVQFKARTSRGTVEGFFYPELVLDHRFIHYGGYEAQNKLEHHHIAKSPQIAMSMWKAEQERRLAANAEEFKKQKEQEKPKIAAQGGLFDGQ